MIIFLDFRFKNLTKTIPRLNCSERCQAPDSFFTGSPWLSEPIDGNVELKENESKEVEWQLWSSVNSLDGSKFSINNVELQIQDSMDQNVDGLIFTLKNSDVGFFGKYFKIPATLRISSNPSASKWTISVTKEDKGT